MRIMKKRYLRFDIELVSSLSIGSGENDHTDHDVLVGADGTPFIPGSAVAGVIRHALTDLQQPGKALDPRVFGRIGNEEGSHRPDDILESRIVTYDIALRGQQVITTRDMVRLDDYKTAEQGAKFDMEAVEPGAVGTVIIEENLTEEDLSGVDPDTGRPRSPLDEDMAVFRWIARAWQSGRIRFGAKTSRGYGAIKVREEDGQSAFRIAEFDMTMDTSAAAWLAFDPFDDIRSDGAWQQLTVDAGRIDETRIVLRLHQAEGSGISIRRYTTALPIGGISQPDSEQMTYHNADPEDPRDGGDPVIPGTSWAGAFRHAMAGMMEADETKACFGDVNVASGNRTRSQIYFSESRITFDGRRSAHAKVYTRNAINRFSGGTKDGGLFTERTYYDGSTDLIITVRNRVLPQICHALASAIVDLDEGFLSVGGETAIGRGLFKVVGIEINGENIAWTNRADDNYERLRNRLETEGARA